MVLLQDLPQCKVMKQMQKFRPMENGSRSTGTQYGNSDVYIMPVEGGDIKQLTYYSGSDDVSSWSWDSKYIYFTSGKDGAVVKL